ncbi:hypothetical protein THOM_3187 [Trachipleistophora hominis]|uniref:Uncharacterized protein n=1 Tax=Trachipleistophora hominis TaxID=72359 RepID=L7JR43_TRAHO|nr:hypothetical protein THOM_3187 [Trachipleistophora hominis]
MDHKLFILCYFLFLALFLVICAIVILYTFLNQENKKFIRKVRIMFEYRNRLIFGYKNDKICVLIVMHVSEVDDKVLRIKRIINDSSGGIQQIVEKDELDSRDLSYFMVEINKKQNDELRVWYREINLEKLDSYKTLKRKGFLIGIASKIFNEMDVCRFDELIDYMMKACCCSMDKKCFSTYTLGDSIYVRCFTICSCNNVMDDGSRVFQFKGSRGMATCSYLVEKVFRDRKKLKGEEYN